MEHFKQRIVPLRQQLFSTAKRMLSEEDAEDVVQETLLRLWTMREQWTTIDNLEGFAMQITKNLCIDRLRTQHATGELEEVLLASHEAAPDIAAEDRNAADWVEQLIDRLPELQSRIIRMRDIEGYELKEIAEMTGAQVSAVTMNLSRARKTVRERLTRIMRYGTAAAVGLLLAFGAYRWLFHRPQTGVSVAYVNGKACTDADCIRTAALNTLNSFAPTDSEALSEQAEMLNDFFDN